MVGFFPARSGSDYDIDIFLETALVQVDRVNRIELPPSLNV